MNKHQEQLQQIDMDIESMKRNIELAEALERLEQNPDYKKIIEDLYFEKEPSRLVLLKASPMAQMNGDMMRDIVSQIDAIGGFFQFLLTIKQQAQSARNHLAEHQNTRQEILEEQLESAGTVQ